jgi:hypothetical protein
LRSSSSDRARSPSSRFRARQRRHQRDPPVQDARPILDGRERREDTFDATEDRGQLVARHAIEIAHAFGHFCDQRVGG